MQHKCSKQLVRNTAVAVWLAFTCALAQAAERWPTRPITLVVPFAPGGVADGVARPVAEALSRELGQPVVVDNRAGAGGGIGMGNAARAQPDGYTVLLALSSISLIPEADKVLGRKPLYQLEQFKPIARLTADPTVLVVRATSPWRTVQDFLNDVRKKPGRYSYGSSGSYGTMHVPMTMFSQRAGIEMLHVPYAGAGPALVGLMSAQVDAVSTGPSSAIQLIKSGKLRALAHWGSSRLEALPDVPALTELGHSAEFAQWSGLFVPAGIAEPVAKRLQDAARNAANDPKVISTMRQAGSPIRYLDTSEFQAYWAGDAARMSKVIQTIGKVD